MKKKIILIFTLLASIAHAQDRLITTGADFKSLFNQFRVAQPKNIPWSGNFFPYGDKGLAIKLNQRGSADPKGISPLENYGKIMGLGSKAHDWELDHHTCDTVDKSFKKSCIDWWGHCNGWAAAAIKEPEPRKSIAIKGTQLSVADQKGILSELWLASYSLNTGETDKSTKMGSWVREDRSKSFAYQSFWDVTPLTLFTVFTNHVGAMGTGIVIDRHSGDEVWNQPVVGYRMMPILKSDIKEITDRGVSYWQVKMGIKIFWANDLGISAGHIARPFDIFNMTRDEVGLRPVTGDVEHISKDYEGRYLEFFLNFDKPLVMNNDGTKVINSGRIIGDGVWEHQLNSRRYTLEELKHSHPDFIWLPTNPYQDQSGYGNPYMVPEISQLISAAAGHTREDSSAPRKPVPDPKGIKISFRSADFKSADLNPETIKKTVKKILLRDSIPSRISSSGIEIVGNKVLVTMEVEADLKYLAELFRAAKLPFTVI